MRIPKSLPQQRLWLQEGVESGCGLDAKHALRVHLFSIFLFTDICSLKGSAKPASISSPHSNLCSSLAYTIAGWPDPLFPLQIRLDLTTKPFSCQSDPLFLCMPQSVLQPSLCCRVFPAPGLLCAGLGGPVRNVMRRGGGRQAQKKGVLNCSHTEHPPPTDLSLTCLFFFFKGGGRAKKRV